MQNPRLHTVRSEIPVLQLFCVGRCSTTDHLAPPNPLFHNVSKYNNTVKL